MVQKKVTRETSYWKGIGLGLKQAQSSVQSLTLRVTF